MTYMKRVPMQICKMDNTNVRGKHQQCEKEVAPMWAVAPAQEKQARELFIKKTTNARTTQLKKNNFVKKTKLKFHFINFPLSLILNSTSTSIGSGFYLGTLN
jgi:hypothetical protein